MKTIEKIILALSAWALIVTMTSCHWENLPVGSPSGTIKAKASTQNTISKVSNVELGTLGQSIAFGNGLLIEEYISDNLSLPVNSGEGITKGTVITNDNIGTPDGYMSFGIEGFLDNYEDLEGEDFNMPVLSNTDQYISGGIASYSDGDWSIADGSGNVYPWLLDMHFTFWSYAPISYSSKVSCGSAGTRTTMTISDYTTPSNAVDQKDIIIAYNNRWYNDDNLSETIDIHFRHALADICFDISGITGYSVTSVSISGVFSKGSCTVTGSDLSDTDVTKAFVWTLDNTKTGTFVMTSGFGESNTPDHFFMIPQTLTAAQDAQISITLSKDGTTVTESAPFKAVWEAGKYYRYVLKYSGELDIQVAEEFDNSVKENVGAENTGSVTEFVRAAITANWVDSEKVLLPCDYTSEYTMLTGFPGTGWTLHSDGFYYYEKAIKGGKTSNGKVFTKYQPVEGHGLLQMTIMVQGVEYDSECAKAKTAWGSDIPITNEMEEL